MHFSVLFLSLINFPQISTNNHLVIALAKHLNVQNCVSGETNPENVKFLSGHFIYSNIYRENVFPTHDIQFYGNSLIILKTDTFLDIISKQKLDKISTNINWLIERNDRNLSTPLPVYIPFDSDFWIAEKHPISDTHHLSTIYQLRSNYPQIVEPYGTFTHQAGISASLLLPSVTRHNYHNISFIIFVAMPNLCDFYSICAHYKMWSDFGMVLNYTQIDANPVELKTIYKGEFDGEGIHAPFHATFGTDKNLLAVTLKGVVYMYIRDRLDTHSDTWLAFSKPFEGAVWVSLAGWLVISSVILIILHYFQGYHLSFIIQSAFTPLDAICNQGGSVTSGTLLSRWSLLMPRVLSAILYPAYAAAVISFITVIIPVVPFSDIIGFYEDGTYQLGSLKADSFTSRYFNDSPVPELKEIGRRMQLPYHQLMNTYEENLNYLCGKKYVFLSYDDIIDNVAKPCRILKIATPVAQAYAGLSLQQNSTFKKSLKLVLLRMHSSGYISRIHHQLVKARTDNERTLDPIAMPQVLVPFLIFGAGLITSLIILSIEMIFHQRPIQTNPATIRKHRGVIVQRCS